MKNRLMFISFIGLLSILISSSVLNLHKVKATSINLKDFSNQFLEEGVHFKSLIKIRDFEITKKEILINAEITEKFAQLRLGEQFGFLAYYAKYLRHYLRNDLNNSPLQLKEINIVCSSKDKIYRLTNIIPNKKIKVISESELYVNNKLAMGSKEYKIKLEHSLHNNQFEFIDQDIEIIRYAISLFNKYTVGGKYYNHEKDSKVILDLTTKKFGITEQEYTDIYKKYFFLIE